MPRSEHRHRERAIGSTLAALIAATAVAAPPLLETPTRSFPTGDQIPTNAYRPADLAIGDFDEDGFPDVALAHDGNFIAPKFSIHLNQGDGTLGPARTFATSDDTRWVCVADVTGNGHLDVMLSEVEHFGPGRLFVLPGNGDGTFGPERRTVVPRAPQRPVVFDLDNDGDLDLAVPHRNQEAVSILTNDGSGFFAASTFSLPGGNAFAVAAGDLDGDGWMDLGVVPANATWDVAILKNDQAGGFHAPAFYDPVTFARSSIQFADVDTDGHLDLVVSTAWMRNLGDGTFGAADELPVLALYSYFDDVSVADLNGDGDVDFAGLRYYDYDAGWLLIESDGAGGYQPPSQFRSGEYAQGIETADMDLDGDLDVVVVNNGSLTVTVHLNNDGDLRMPELSFNSGWLAHDLESGDLDLDGDLDFVTGASILFRHMNNGDGTFTAHEFNPLLGQKFRFRLRDVNGDRFPDLLFIRHPNTPPYNFYWALNNGDGSFGAGQVLVINSCGTGDLDTVDFDSDGDLDVVITDHLGCPSQEGVKLILVENEGDGTFSLLGKIVNFISSDPYRVITGDFDNDGIGDIVGTLSENVAWWRGNGDGTFDDQILSDIDPMGLERNPWFIVSDDFNGDDNLDIATANGGWTFRGANITVLLGNGDGTFTGTGLHYTMFSLWFGGMGGIDSLDVDGDGDRDLAFGADYGCDIGLLINDGTGTFTLGDRYGVNGGPVDIVTADLDADGREDVAAQVGIHFDGGLTVLRGIGSEEPVAGDLDGDGRVDFTDLLILLASWGPCPPECPSDLDGDGSTGFGDLLIVLSNWT